MPADDTNVNKSYFLTLYSPKFKFGSTQNFPMRKAKKLLQDVLCEEVQDVEKKVLKIADFKLCNLLICCTHCHAHNRPPGCPPRNPPIILPNQASS